MATVKKSRTLSSILIGATVKSLAYDGSDNYATLTLVTEHGDKLRFTARGGDGYGYFDAAVITEHEELINIE